MKAGICTVMLACLAFAARLEAACPDLDAKGLQALVSKGAPTRVVFFASWCGDCQAHLPGDRPQSTLYIATFDERPAAEAVANKLLPSGRCYVDQGIAAALGIKGVPAEIDYDGHGHVLRRSPR